MFSLPPSLGDAPTYALRQDMRRADAVVRMLSTRHVLPVLASLASTAGGAAALEGPRYQVTLHPIAGWTKSCHEDKATGGTTCYTTRLFGRDAGKPPMLDLSVRDVGREGAHVLRLVTPLGLRTDLGLTVSIDGGERQPGVFKGCARSGCLAEAALETPVLAAMKKGGTMQIVTTDARNRRVDFYLSLSGFAAAYDGAGTDDRPPAPPGKTAPLKSRSRGRDSSI